MDRGDRRRSRRSRPGWTMRPTRPNGWPVRPATTRDTLRRTASAAAGRVASRIAISGARASARGEAPAWTTISGPVPATAASAARRSSACRAAGSAPTNGATWAMPSRHAASSAGADQPGLDRDRPQPHVGEAGRGRVPADRGRVAGPRLGVLLERHVPRRGPVAERAEDLVDGRLGRVVPARRERAGRQPAATRRASRRPAARAGPGDRGRTPPAPGRSSRPGTAARSRRPPPGAASGPHRLSMASAGVGRRPRPRPRPPARPARPPRCPRRASSTRRPPGRRPPPAQASSGPGQAGVDGLRALGPQPRRPPRRPARTPALSPAAGPP